MRDSNGGTSAPEANAVLSRGECARWLRVSPRTLDRSAAPRTKVRRRVRFVTSEVLDWLRHGGDLSAPRGRRGATAPAPEAGR